MSSKEGLSVMLLAGLVECSPIDRLMLLPNFRNGHGKPHAKHEVACRLGSPIATAGLKGCHVYPPNNANEVACRLRFIGIDFASYIPTRPGHEQESANKNSFDMTYPTPALVS